MAELTKIGRGGHVAGYDVLILCDRIHVLNDAAGAREIWTHEVPNHGTAIGELAERPGSRIDSGRFPGGAEALYFYDRDDGNCGYAPNVTGRDGEWGNAPF